jgi:hypothetical protein
MSPDALVCFLSFRDAGTMPEDRVVLPSDAILCLRFFVVMMADVSILRDANA